MEALTCTRNKHQLSSKHGSSALFHSPEWNLHFSVQTPTFCTLNLYLLLSSECFSKISQAISILTFKIFLYSLFLVLDLTPPPPIFLSGTSTLSSSFCSIFLYCSESFCINLVLFPIPIEAVSVNFHKHGILLILLSSVLTFLGNFGTVLPRLEKSRVSNSKTKLHSHVTQS